MLTRILILIVLASAVLAGLTTALRQDHASVWRALWTRILRGSEDAHQVSQFKVDLLDYANATQGGNRAQPLRLDQDLEEWLQGEIQNGLTLDDLDAVINRIQKQWPRYMRLSLTTATGPTLEQTKAHLRQHLDRLPAEMTHLACAFRASAGGIASQVLLVAGQRLRDFSPELLHTTQDESFYHVCPHCQTGHISRLQRHLESITLECPSCLRAYAVIASDTRGRFHYVNEFLTGYQPPAVFPVGQSRVEQLFTIWSAVHQNCRYTRDPGESKQRTDRWQTAVETQVLGTGDCEDSAIYLADWLIARGYEARVALGKYGDIGGHAWVVVRLDGLEYLLESTSEGHPDLDHPPLVSRMGSRYIPEVQFDRWSLYVRAERHQPWQGDYWSERAWLRIQPQHKPDKAVAVAKNDFSLPGRSAWQSAKNDLLSLANVAYIRRSDRQAAPFIHLEEALENHDRTTWRLPVARPDSPGNPCVDSEAPGTQP